jgi:cell division septum initiation protein DivIVA
MPERSEHAAYDRSMIDPAPRESPEPRFDPDKVAVASFDVVRRGFNEEQVRQFLRDLSASLRVAYRTEDRLRSSIAEFDAKLVDASEIDEHTLTERLGAEAAAILNVARESAAVRLAEAEADAERLATSSREEADAVLTEARDQAERLSTDSQAQAETLLSTTEERATEVLAAAEAVLDERTAEADAEAARRVAAVDDEVAQRRAEGEGIIAEAKQQGRVLLIEAQHHREQLLQNLEQRRRRIRDQVERLQAGRDRLLEAYEVVQRTIDTARHDLKVALPEAKIAGDRAARRADEDLPRSIEALESELDEARRAGLLGDLDVIAAEAAAAGGVELPLAPAPRPEPEAEAEVEPAREAAPALEAAVESEPEAAVEAAPEAPVEPEPEAAVEPEPEAAVEAAPEPEPDPVAEPDVVTEASSLFDRLRADREAEVLAAEAVLADGAPEPDPVAVDDAVGTKTSTDDLVAARTSVIDAVVPAMAKRAKRSLSDLQNELLAALRTGSEVSIDTAAVEAALTESLPTAWAAGAAAIGRPGTATDAKVGRIVDALEADVFGPLRDELGQAVRGSDDPVEGVRGVVRVLRPRLAKLAESAIAAAFLDGLLDTLPDGCPVRWMAGDGPDDAKHAATNGSVEIRLGAEFPTGEVRPAPLGDCRCLVVPLHL